MSVDPVWPVRTPASVSRRWIALDGGGGGCHPATAWDVAGLLRTLRDNRPAAARVVRAFLDDAPRVVLELRAAVSDGNRVALQHQVHRLKGNAGILRAKALREAAETLGKIADGEDLSAVAVPLAAVEQHLASLCQELEEFLVVPGAPSQATRPPTGS